MDADDLGDLFLHGKDRVERGHGVLKDHGYLAAANLADIMIAHLQNVLPFKEDAPTLNLCRRGRQQVQNTQRRSRLPGARLAHQPQRLPDADGQVYVGHRVDDSIHGNVFHCQILDFKQCLAHALPPLIA